MEIVGLELVKKNRGSREILIWGAWDYGMRVMEMLKMNQVEVKGFVDKKSEKGLDEYEGYIVYNSHIINKEKYYVVCAIVEHEDVYRHLREFGYVEYNDYFYLGKKITINNAYNYLDVYGNAISGKIKNCRVNLCLGAQLVVEDGVFLDNNTEITLINSRLILKSGGHMVGGEVVARNNADIQLGENFYCDENVIIHANAGVIDIGAEANIGRCTKIDCMNSTIKIESDFECYNNTNIGAWEKSQIVIGKRASFGEYNRIHATKGEIKIGDECMASFYVHIRATNAHSMYSINTRQPLSERRGVNIGNHVWLATNAAVFPGSRLGNGMIVGAFSMTNSYFADNTLVVGTPARLQKKDVSWTYDMIDREKL